MKSNSQFSVSSVYRKSVPSQTSVTGLASPLNFSGSGEWRSPVDLNSHILSVYFPPAPSELASYLVLATGLHGNSHPQRWALDCSPHAHRTLSIPCEWKPEQHHNPYKEEPFSIDYRSSTCIKSSSTQSTKASDVLFWYFQVGLPKAFFVDWLCK